MEIYQYVYKGGILHHGDIINGFVVNQEKPFLNDY